LRKANRASGIPWPQPAKGPGVDEFTYEDGLTLRMPIDNVLLCVAEWLEQSFEGVSASVDVINEVVHG
jgi:hypothetical protein